MFEQMIIEQGAPTLAGLKTANLFPTDLFAKNVYGQISENLTERFHTKE